ncbi:Actin- protein 5 [Ordospora colligata]|uniref:Actin-like protein n=1 Tax=Ordospora colligata OC4 TaxID=1354746 RepID=A0A0B2UNB1_9MICR|nr:uncharacterized protein M896_012180 [Ordospora colligata OC4]KHN70562.1 hypothetical protein M896_012180 [Ordospora colligata OC4]TBU17312.1 hypothetical protein CWI41_012180 [Ordospora colligata]TBU17562.1 hypothetical protein CWI40_012180 [Ordospora colligata]
MYVELSKKAHANKYGKYVKNDTIVIDNGVYECKAGYSGQSPQMVFMNVLYRQKTSASIESFQGAVLKTMFDGDVLINFEVLESMIDEVLAYLKPERLQNLIFTEKIYSPTHTELVKFLFEVYGFEKIQIGVDSYYSYLWNMRGEDCMVVDMSHTAVTCLVIYGGRIADVYKINFGGCAAEEYLCMLMFNKFFDNKKSYGELVKYLRCSRDYCREAVDVLDEMKEGEYSRSYFLDEEVEIGHQRCMDAKQKRCSMPSNPGSVPEINTNLLNTIDSELNDEEIREKKRQRILYHSALHRVKSRAEKCLEKLKMCMSLTEEKIERMSDPAGFINAKKAEFQRLKRELELRGKTRRDVKNRKTYEFQVRFKEGLLTDDEKLLIAKIKDAEDMDQEVRLIDSLRMLASQIKELDPYFEPFTADVVDILNGYSIGRMCVNIDLMRIPEIFFLPSIIGLDQMGLTEIMENVSRKYNTRKVLLTGGFSQIEGIGDRIQIEMSSVSVVGDVQVIMAADPVNDAFKGATMCNMFPVYTIDQYHNMGAEEMIRSMNSSTD